MSLTSPNLLVYVLVFFTSLVIPLFVLPLVDYIYKQCRIRNKAETEQEIEINRENFVVCVQFPCGRFFFVERNLKFVSVKKKRFFLIGRTGPISSFFVNFFCSCQVEEEREELETDFDPELGEKIEYPTNQYIREVCHKNLFFLFIFRILSPIKHVKFVRKNIWSMYFLCCKIQNF